MDRVRTACVFGGEAARARVAFSVWGAGHPSEGGLLTLCVGRPRVGPKDAIGSLVLARLRVDYPHWFGW